MSSHLNKLKQIGFIKAGNWTLKDTKLCLDLIDCAQSSNVLYCFVSEGKPVYLGKTSQTLKKRMQGYLKPGRSQHTNIRNNLNINNTLEQGSNIEIYALPDNGLLHFGGFHINLAAALEDSIITSIKPLWNINGTK